MGIAAMTLGVVGLFAWTFPFLGFPISIIGLILGIVALLVTKEHRKKAIAAIIMCIIGLAINIGVVVGLVVAGGILAELLPQLGNNY